MKGKMYKSLLKKLYYQYIIYIYFFSDKQPADE